jgi:carboxyl-terminal processing protease
MTPSRLRRTSLSGFLLLLAVPVAGAGQAPAFTPALARATVDSVWNRVANTHFDPDFGGVDWVGVRQALEPRLDSITTQEGLRALLREMLGALGLSHFVIFPGDEEEAPGSGAGTALTDPGHPGFELRMVDGAPLVWRLDPAGPAQAAGVRTGWRLLAVDGIAVSARGPAEARLRGEAGTLVTLALEDGSGEVQTLELLRAPPAGELFRFGNLPPFPLEVETETLTLEGGASVGRIRLTGWFPPAVTPLAEAVDRHRGARGIILDLRGNPGGVGGLAMGVSGHFVDEPLPFGIMQTRDTRLRFVVAPQRIAPSGQRVTPFAGPLAILVDAGTGSTSEIFAQGMQSLGRARILGETTAGAVLPSLLIPLPNGDRFMHAIADYTAPDGTRLEGRGVIPDDVVVLDRASLLAGRDPVLEAALAWIASQPPQP